MRTVRFVPLAAVVALALLGGCATRPPPYDYTAFEQAKPATLLVLPPVNESPDVNATPGVWAQATMPLSEAGYYVLPVTLVDKTFRDNGVITANDAQNIAYKKLRDFFGADAAVYIRVKKYGTSYHVVASDTTVEVEARILDLRTGAMIWEGKALASSAEQSQQTPGGIVGLLVAAVVKQIVGTATDESFKYAGLADARLLAAPHYNSVLPGPRSPLYGKPPAR